MSDSSSSSDDVPHHLMPVAAVLGTYSLVATVRALNQVYRNVRYGNKVTAEMRLRGDVPKPVKSGQFALLVLSIAGSTLLYGYVTALVNNAVAASDVFDPFDILGIDSGANNTVVKSAYRALSKTHHPDKGGDSAIFRKLTLAYKSLTDSVSRENWEKYGHPDGPQTQTLSFALPDWLLHPEGTTAAVLVLLYLGMFVGLIVWVLKFVRKTESAASKAQLDSSVAGADMAYLASHLTPESTHLDVLFLIATTPENVEISRKAIEKSESIRAEKLELLNKKKAAEKKNGAGGALEFDVEDDGGWADDDDLDDEAKEKAEKAKAAEEQKKREAAQLAQVTGKAASAENVKLEGLDEGVLGQKWVETSLEKEGAWPPTNMGAIETMAFDNGKGKQEGPLESKAVRRNLCMTMGRLNAQMLNSHPELVSAGQKGLIDPTYFKATMEFRQRTGLLLEAALRVSMSVRSYRLAKTIVEAVSMFKIGTMSHDDAKTLSWFKDVMKRQYGGDAGVPSLEFLSKDVETPGEDEVATGDVCSLAVHIERKHAENFTQQKLALCQKQGIPPQVAMQTYREGWWIMIRARKVDGEGKPTSGGDDDKEDEAESNPLMKMLDADAKKRFEGEKEENRLCCAWPFIVSNVAQKQGKVNVKFKAPDVPGKYEFLIAVKSQEFLGADQEFTITKEVLDKEEVERKQREEEGEDEDADVDGEEGEEEEEEEPKKTK
uniref:J domain-containing protein n=1 Tax=Odontella aurita TaxID=265563 RepID=A0A7S4N457_9STRA|mmetsp:Transcript_47066/g.142530  ORF Transcript_47066/g.142530 Transcript_47066/m.142530 type:complete len:718 (+) Transcript_47066:183-2336(+)|eukprot:CAMPEP_0113544198 /NCGR_PEP_ID=MMETSP0015_2-20120614/10578_1 /TAXON_ID=2838 /ORGANISM="Odontella" /LENGTH=717 /DNA_ID=CAMNT_0000444437 /DNA_START=273 /DNA_END=2426 /DNA_ORIENTATION=+ /assembly_acc=CAM_ASM_000160